MSYPPEGFLALIVPPAYWEPQGPNTSTLQGYVCNPLKHAIGILVTEGPEVGEVLHVDWTRADYLEGLRGLLVTDENAVTHTTEVCLQFDPKVGVLASIRADTNAIPMQAAVERVMALKQQHAARMEAAKAESDRIVEAARLEAEADAQKIAEAVAAEPAAESENPPGPN